MSAKAARVGFFGKLPSRGDFVKAALSRPLVQAWDQWLQPLLPAAREKLGEGWSEAWHTMHPWRFAIAADLYAAHPVSGVWLASADKAGRDFPLTIAAEAGPCEAFLDAAEDLGREAISSHMAPDTLVRRVALLPRPGASAAPVEGGRVRWWRRREADQETFHADRLPDVDVFLGMLTP